MPLPTVVTGLPAALRKEMSMTLLHHEILQVLLPGFTHHVDIGKGADAMISYGAAGAARMLIPGQEAMTGRWHALQTGYHVAWDGGPAGDWQISHEAGRLTYIDPTGREAGTVTRIEPIGPWPAI
jgi:hypothetical protein